MRRIVILLILTLFYLPSYAQQGRWQGELNAAGLKIKLIFDIVQSDNSYSSTLTVPIQNVDNLKMDITTFEDGELTIVSNSIGLNYIAQFEEDEFSGVYSQNGIVLDLTLQREKIQSEAIIPYQTPKPTSLYTTKQVEFENPKEGNILSGSLTIPSGESKGVAVVLISGSGGQNRDNQVGEHRPFLVIADYLSSRGIAVLRYDDRGIGQSVGGKLDATTADIAYDAQGAVEYLRARGEFSRVGVIGHSEGGAIAFMLAGNRDYIAPDFIVSLAGIGVKGSQILLDQNTLALQKLGVPDQAISTTLAGVKQMYSIVENSKKVDDKLKKSIRKVLEDMLPKGVDKSMADMQNDAAIESVTMPWAYYFIKYDPKNSIEATKVPVLALNGRLDMQVECDKNLAAIESALKKGGNKNYKIVAFDGLNHMFQTAKSGDISEYAELEESFSEEVLREIMNWL